MVHFGIQPGAPSHPASGPAAERPYVGRQETAILDTLGNLGEFVGGLAVVVTLIYLAIQVRHNTAALRTASRQEIVSGFRAHNRLFLEPSAGRTYAEGLRAHPDMPFDERNLFVILIFDHALFFQGAFALHESGQLEGETYQAYLTWFTCQLATPGGAAWWAESRQSWPARMVEALDARLSRGDLPDIREMQPFRLDDYPPVPARKGEDDQPET
jgi:hypothetical protein